MALKQSFSGVRGLWQKEIDEDIALKYAYLFYNKLKIELKKEPKIVIGRDTRKNNEFIASGFYSVFNNIIDIGIASTPETEFAVRYFGADCGVMITASHNEPNFNGFKLLDEDGGILRPKNMDAIIQAYKNIEDIDIKDFYSRYLKKNRYSKIKNMVHADIKERYSRFVIKIIGRLKNNKLKVIIDPNGGTGVIAKEILLKLGVEVISVNDEIGKFNRMIEPNKRSLSYLKKIIREKNADLAAGFDCDADRVEVLDEKGNMISGQYVLALIVDYILSTDKKARKKPIVINDATSYLVKDIVEKYGGKIEEVEVGEINVVDAMELLGSYVGGEGSSSGAIVKGSRCRDGMITLALIIKYITESGKKLSEIIDSYPRYHTLRENIRIKEKNYAKIRKGIEKHYSDKKLQKTGDEYGGLKVFFDDGWLWFRMSRTEDAVMRIIADSKDEKLAKRLLLDGVKVVKGLK